MTITEANQLLSTVDCNDPEAVAAALTARARAIAEFAATATKELLEETLATGDAFRKRLEMVQAETCCELDRMTKLSRGLESTLDQCESDRVTCFG